MKPCAIVGNGPSALNIPSDPHMPLFGMNYTPVQPDYYVCVDSAVLLYHWKEIYTIASAARIIYLSGMHEGSSILYDLPQVRLVHKDNDAFKAEQFMSGFTAAYVALKCAYYLGFDTVHLWGVDHSPGWEHYREDYPIGVQTNAARMEMMEWHYRMAAEVYRRAGHRIFNHSLPSALDNIFERAK